MNGLNNMSTRPSGRPIAGTLISAVIGGTASVLGGGKFANGAQTAAFGYLFNSLAHAWAGTEATYALGRSLNVRDGFGAWAINHGTFLDILLDGRADLIFKATGETFEIKTNNCLQNVACEQDAQQQLNRYVASSNGTMRVGEAFTVFRGSPFLLADGQTMGVDLTFRYNPGPAGGLIGYDIVDSQVVVVRIWQSFNRRKIITNAVSGAVPGRHQGLSFDD
jgi:hypothetical protein